eukprot:TRINITY_DN2347_c0_g1_i9.p1 TRINITY_DN2347_c0_g1~~TRINITY_DN2347_c0_g1_i9.p1  ORF type:complete len:725 (-),score=163.78 TRINITY_DN2347_c0_g1_i9:204-2378(-)
MAGPQQSMADLVRTFCGSQNHARHEQRGAIKSEAEFSKEFTRWSAEEVQQRRKSRRDATNKWRLETEFEGTWLAERGEYCMRCASGLLSSLPSVRWMGAYRWRQSLRVDVVAGLIVGVMLIPQGMAYGLLAGLPPEYGLYSSIWPSVFYMLMGCSKHLQVGTNAPISILTDEIIAPIVSADCHDPEAAQCVSATVEATLMLSIMIGAIYCLMGTFKLGIITSFMPNPALTGFTTGASGLIFTANMKHLVGLDVPSGFSFMQWSYILRHLGDVNVASLIIGLVALAILVLIKMFNKHHELKFPIPEQLVVLVLGILVTKFGELDARFGVKIVGEIPGGLHTPAFPTIGTSQMLELLQQSVIAALVIYILSVNVAKSLGNSHGYHVDANQELWALCAASVVGGLTGAYPPSGSFSRSALVATIGPGDKGSALHNLVSAMVVALVCLALTPALYHLPKPVLASVIFTALTSMVTFKEARVLYRVSRWEFALWVVAALGTFLFGVTYGIMASVASALFVLLTEQTRPGFSVLGFIQGANQFRDTALFEQAVQFPGIKVCRFNASLHFANSEHFEAKVNEALSEDAAAGKEAVYSVIVDASSLNRVDTTAISMLVTLHESLAARGIELSFAGWKSKCAALLGKFGFDSTGVPAERWYLCLHDAVIAAHTKHVELEKAKSDTQVSPNAIVVLVEGGAEAELGTEMVSSVGDLSHMMRNGSREEINSDEQL